MPDQDQPGILEQQYQRENGNVDCRSIEPDNKTIFLTFLLLTHCYRSNYADYIHSHWSSKEVNPGSE